MKHSHKKSFDWYSMQQRYSIRKYHFGAASVLLGTALVLGTVANTQSVKAEEQHPEATNSVSVDKVEETTKPAEVSTPKKETTYAAPIVANPVETTPAKTEEATRPAEKVEEAKDKKEEVTHQDAVDKSKLLTALSRAKKLESKLYTEASATNLQASIQAGQSLLGKADATEAEVSAAESSIQSAIIGLELRSNSDKGTVSETPVVKKADAVEAKEETKPATRTTDRSAVDSSVLATNAPAKVETTSVPASTNEILKPGLSLSDARQNPAIRKEDLDKGHSGFRASSNPANPIVSGSGNTVAFSDISQAGRSYSFRGYGNSRGGNSIHYDVTTVRQGNRLNFTIEYSGPGEFVNNNFILDKGDGFGNPSNATITTPRLREQSKPISQGANYVSHSGYSMTSATSTSERQTIRFSLPIINPNGDLSVRLKPVTFNVNQGGGSAATSNDPYSNSNYYYRATPLYLDANPYGGTNNKTVSEDIDFQTVYLPTSKLPEGQTRLVREGEKGQRQITYKVHRFGNETLLGLPISNSVTKEAKPRIMQIGVAKELIDTVKPRVDQNKVGDTNNLTFYLDNDGNGVYTEGVDELVQKIAIKDGAKGEKGDQGERGLTGAKGEKGDRGERGLTGAKGEKGDQGERGLTGAKGEKGDQGERGLTGAKGEKGDRGERGLTGAKGEKGDQGERGLTGAKGEKGDQGERGLTGAKGEKGDRGERGLTGAKGEKGDQGQAGRDGVTPTVTVKDNKDDGTHTITINDGRGNVTSTVVRDGFDGASPLVATQRNDADKTTTVIFYYDQNDNNEFDAGDTKLKEVVIADGAKGEKGDQGERGLTGAQGEKGDRGDRGETGAAGRDGKTPKITTARGADGRSTDITFTIPGEEPVVANIKDGKDGRTPTIDLNALVEAVRRGVGSTSNSQPSGTSRSARNRRALPDEDRSATESSETVQPSTTGSTGSQPATAGSTASQPTSTQPKPSGEYAGTEIKAYYDNNHNGVFDEGDELISSTVIPPAPKGENGNDGKDAIRGAELLSGIIAPRPEDGKDGDTYIDATTGDVYKKRDGAWGKIGNIRGPQGEQGPKGDKGENGKDGFTPEVTVTDNNNGTHTITITQPDNKPSLTTIVKNGEDGQTPKVKAERDEAKKQTTLTFYIDKDGDGNYTEGTDTLVQTTVVKDGQDGAKGADGASGRDGKEVLNGKVDPKATDGKDGDSFVNTETGDVFVKKNNAWEPAGNITGPKGEDGKTPEVTVTPGKDGNSSDITFTVPGKNPVTVNVKNGENGLNGKTPKVDLLRVEGQNGNPSHTIVTFYTDENGDGKYTPGTDELLGSEIIKDGASGRDGKEVLNGKVDPKENQGKDGDTFVNTETGDVFVKKNNAWEPAGNIKGPKGDKGEDGKTPEITTKPGADGKSTDVTITVPGKDPVTVNIKDGKDGKSLVAKKEGNETKIYVEDPANPGQPLDPTKPLATVLDGLKGEKGDKGENGADGKSPVVNVTDNGDGTHSITVRNPDGSESTTKVKDGKDGKTATITTTENPDGSHTITVTNPDGTTKETVVKNGKDGKTPKVEVTDNNDGTHTVKVTDGDGNVTNAVIKDGKDGKAATATTTENPDGSHRVTITNPDGTKNEFVVKNGRDGVDGRTPTASVRDNGDGSHTIVITNPEGVTTETTVRDGKSPKVTITDEQNGTHKISVLNGDGTTTETIIKDGKSPVATVRDNQDGTYTIRVENGNGTVSETTVRDGKSPTAKVVDNGDGTHTITVVNSDGTTTTTTVRDGKEPKLEVIDNNNGSHTIKVTGADGKETTTTIFDGKSPKANIVDNGDGTHTLTIVDSDGREYKSIIKDGKDGKDGVSPTVTVKNNNDGTHVVTIINPDGSKTEMVIKDGKDGKSPNVSVEDNGDGSHTITIINSDGTVTKTVVKDGKDGRDGKDGKDGKCGCKDKPVTPSNDKPVPPVNELPEYTGGVTPLDPPVYEKPELELPEIPTPPVHEVPEFNGGVPGMPEVNELPNPEVPGMPTPPVQEIPEFNGGVPGMPEVNDKPTSNIPEVPTQPNSNVPVQPVTPLTSNPVAPTTGKENHGDKLPETGSQSDYISVLLGSGILLSLYVGRRKED